MMTPKTTSKDGQNLDLNVCAFAGTRTMTMREAYLLHIPRWPLPRHQLTQCPGYLWAHPDKKNLQHTINKHYMSQQYLL